VRARRRLLAALARLHEELGGVAEQAAEEGDHWTGLTVGMVAQAVDNAAQAAETERRKRGER